MEPTPVAAAMAALRSAVTGLQMAVGQELYRSLDGEVGELIEQAHLAEGQLRSVSLALVGEFEDRGIATAVGAVSTRSWLRDRLRETVSAAGVTAKMALACSAKGPHAEVGAALASGGVNWDQARVTVTALDRLPATTPLEHREFALRLLLDKARELNADDLRRVGQGLLEAADPDGKLPDDEELEKVRGVHFKDHHDGTHSVTWRDRIENVGLAKAALEALAKPRPQPDGSADPRSAPARRADALVDIFGVLLRHGDLPNSRGRAPHLHLTLGLDTLRGLDGAAKAALATGGAITAEAVRRLACDAEITPIVLDAKGKPLSVGRRFRTWTPAIWDALVARDTGCGFPACAVPAAYCRGHHIRYWTEHLGPTELDNGVLLCEPHHVQVHHRGWQVRLDAHGIPEFIPPPWIDSLQEPRHNDYWRLQRELLTPPDLPNRG
ncbi:MAG: DUF222 domain-containing protein [Sporichthyaceae bacterium]